MDVIVLVAFVVLTSTVSLGQDDFGSQRVVITSPYLLSVNKAQKISKVDLVAPKTRKPVFCVTSAGSRYIRFTCPDCNNYTKSLNFEEVSQADWPTIVLNEIEVTKEMNQKTLLCEAKFLVNGDEITVSDSAIMNIFYFEKPVITDKEGNLPVKSGQQGQEGLKFYIERSGGQSKTLTCRADANPRPTGYSWSADGQQIGTGQQMNVGSERIGNTIQCSATGSGQYKEGRDSESVKLEPWDKPRLVRNNFETLKKNRFSGSTKIRLRTNIPMQCTVWGNPSPIVLWKQRVGRQVMNASCTPTSERVQLNNNRNSNVRNGLRNNGQFNNNNNYGERSTCSVTVDDYTKAGTYWCSACNSVAQDKYFCDPRENEAPQSNLQIDVIGKPMKSDVMPFVMQSSRDSPAYVYVPYCSDPEPRIPRQLFWTIGGERLDIMQTREHYKAEKPERNNTFYDCFTQRLVINPVTSDDEKNSYVLTVVNQHGEISIPVPVQNMLGNPQNSSSAAWIIILIVAILVLLVLIAVAFCFLRKMFCFATYTKRSPDQKYHSNLAPEHVKTEPIPPPKYDAPPVNSYNSEKNGYPKKEGLTYAEMDLVREPTRPVPTPTEYSHIQHSYPLKSPTNSVV